MKPIVAEHRHNAEEHLKPVNVIAHKATTPATHQLNQKPGRPAVALVLKACHVHRELCSFISGQLIWVPELYAFAH
jgi:hypothetical protein